MEEFPSSCASTAAERSIFDFGSFSTMVRFNAPLTEGSMLSMMFFITCTDSSG